jgi:hypothetical protein
LGWELFYTTTGDTGKACQARAEKQHGARLRNRGGGDFHVTGYDALAPENSSILGALGGKIYVEVAGIVERPIAPI